MWRDIAFAILMALFAAFSNIAISLVVPHPTVQPIFMLLAVLGLAYGVVDVMEDVTLIRLLSGSSEIKADHAVRAQRLTRLKMLTLTASLTGLALFTALGIAQAGMSARGRR